MTVMSPRAKRTTPRTTAPRWEGLAINPPSSFRRPNKARAGTKRNTNAVALAGDVATLTSSAKDPISSNRSAADEPLDAADWMTSWSSGAGVGELVSY